MLNAPLFSLLARWELKHTQACASLTVSLNDLYLLYLTYIMYPSNVWSYRQRSCAHKAEKAVVGDSWQFFFPGVNHSLMEWFDFVTRYPIVSLYLCYWMHVSIRLFSLHWLMTQNISNIEYSQVDKTIQESTYVNNIVRKRSRKKVISNQFRNNASRNGRGQMWSEVWCRDRPSLTQWRKYSEQSHPFCDN